MTGLSSLPSMQLQFRCDEWTFLLDGRVFETFHEGTDTNQRYHVDYLAIETKPTDAGMKVRFGYLVSGSLAGGGRITVPTAQLVEFQAFVDAAVAARTPV
ncbi:hypothetical protein BH10ACT2_BH10ACT2_08490 [soil metagenome]